MKISRTIKALSAAAVLTFSFATIVAPVSAECANSNTIVISADKSSKVKKGWVEKNGKTYYYDSNGKKKTGWATISGEKYYFNKKGIMQKGNVLIDGKIYHFSLENGILVTQYKDITIMVGDKNYPVDKKGCLGKNEIVTVHGVSYYVGAGGYAVSGTKKIDGIKYIFDAEEGVVGIEYTLDSKYGGKGKQQTFDQTVNFRDIRATITNEGDSYNVNVTGIVNNRNPEADIIVSFYIELYDENGRELVSIPVSSIPIQARGSYNLNESVLVSRKVGSVDIKTSTITWRYDSNSSEYYY